MAIILFYGCDNTGFRLWETFYFCSDEIEVWEGRWAWSSIHSDLHSLFLQSQSSYLCLPSSVLYSVECIVHSFLNDSLEPVELIESLCLGWKD